jgi:hypothetical protein
MKRIREALLLVAFVLAFGFLVLLATAVIWATG